MINYVTSDYVLQKVYTLLAEIYVPKYYVTSPDFNSSNEDRPEAYIVLNALPINANFIQKCYVNVNYHVKDVAPGVPDTARIQAGSVAVLEILKKVTGPDYMIDFEQQETFREVDLKEHYSNMRFSFKQINN